MFIEKITNENIGYLISMINNNSKKQQKFNQKISSINELSLKIENETEKDDQILVEDISNNEHTRVILMCPQGRPFTQEIAQELSEAKHIVFICGHYEGYDERIRKHLVTDEISMGDYVLTGGELPAMTMTDAIVRLIPGVLGNQASHQDDSFSDGLLEFPQYTRPREYKNMSVPEVLLSGNHAHIDQWRHEQKLIRTYEKRPDLLEQYPLTEKDREILETYKKKLKND